MSAGRGRYDRLSALQFRVLIDAGLRENHRVCDVGCGSLRLGRLLIPVLKPHRYFGVEPNRWLVEDGFERELGRDIVSIKHPQLLRPGGGNGWLYPKCVRYTWTEVADLIDEAGLVGAYVKRNDRHRQQWLVAGPREGQVRRVSEALKS